MIKKITQLLFLTSGILSAHHSYADCTQYRKVNDSYVIQNRWGGDSYEYNMPSVIRVKSTDQIGQVLAESQGYYISTQNSAYYMSCDLPNIVLSANTNDGYVGSSGLIPTTIEGISYRIIYNNDKTVTSAEQDLFLFTASDSSVFETVRQPEKFKIQLIKTGEYGTPGYIGGVNDRLFRVTNGEQGVITSYKDVIYGYATQTYITMTTCSLIDNNITVDLPVVPKNFFKKVGTVVAAQPFSIKVTCTKDENPMGSELSAISFSFLSEIGTTNVISNTASENKATGIGMNLLLNDKAVENGKKYEIIAIPGGGNFSIPLNMKAQYIQTDEKVTPGDVQGIVTIILTFI